MPALELNAQNAPITASIFRAVLNRLPNKPARIDLHPMQLQAYEETGFAKQEISFTEGKMPGFDGVPNDESSLTICEIPTAMDMRLPKDLVRFVGAGGDIVAEIVNLAVPTYQ